MGMRVKGLGLEIWGCRGGNERGKLKIRNDSGNVSCETLGWEIKIRIENEKRN